MSAWATTWAYEQDIKPCGKKAVLVALAHFSDAEGFCYPGQETLADMTSQGVSTVRAHLEALESGGVIKRGHRYKKGKRTSDGYYLQAPADRLQPQKHYRQKSALVQNELPPEKSVLPPDPAHDLLGDPLEKKRTPLPPRGNIEGLPKPRRETDPETVAIRSLVNEMLNDLELVIGPIRDRKREGGEIKWMLDKGYDPQQMEACMEYTRSDPWWKDKRITWATIAKRIGDWVAKGEMKTFESPSPNGSNKHKTEDPYDPFAAYRPTAEDNKGLSEIVLARMKAATGDMHPSVDEVLAQHGETREMHSGR